MKPRHRIPAVAAAAAAAAAVAVMAVVLLAPGGCASNCGTNCPNVAVYIGNPGVQLPIADIGLDGNACPPPEGVYCIGDVAGTNCTHFTVTGTAQGFCDVRIDFYDRATEIVHTQFGPPVQQGCCKGYSIVGDQTFIVPADPNVEIMGADGGTDAVTVVPDGGAADAGGDAS